MKYRLLLQLLLTLPLLISVETVAQSVCSANLTFSDTAIVRTFGENHALTYTGGNFVLCEGSNSIAQAFSVPFNVKDVEIWDDREAYFCGEYNGRGVMGVFNIADVFSGAAPINYAVTNVTATAPDMTNCFADVLDLTRLALFWDSSVNAVALAMVCLENLQSPNWNRTSVVGAYFNSSGVWPTSVLYNKDGVRMYHDIETLNNLVVATLTDTNHEGCYTRAFNNTHYYFPALPFLGQTAFQIIMENPKGAPQITQMQDNFAAIIQYDQKPGVIMHFLNFNITTGEPTVICQSAMSWPQSTNTYDPGKWWFNGVRFIEDTLYVLGNMNFPGEQIFEKWLLELPNTCSSRNGIMHRFTSSVPYSIDVCKVIGRPVSAGNIFGMLDWDVYIPKKDANCKESFVIGIERQWPAVKMVGADGGEVHAYPLNNMFYPTLFDLTIRKECGYGTGKE